VGVIQWRSAPPPPSHGQICCGGGSSCEALVPANPAVPPLVWSESCWQMTTGGLFWTVSPATHFTMCPGPSSNLSLNTCMCETCCTAAVAGPACHPATPIMRIARHHHRSVLLSSVIHNEQIHNTRLSRVISASGQHSGHVLMAMPRQESYRAAPALTRGPRQALLRPAVDAVNSPLVSKHWYAAQSRHRVHNQKSPCCLAGLTQPVP
jgi:hypothetical protein